MLENSHVKYDTMGLMLRYILSNIQIFIKEMNQRSVSAYAGSTSFFFLLSGFPILILASIGVTTAGLKVHELDVLLTTLVPVLENQMISRLLNEAFRLSSSVLPITILVLVWSCSRGMLALMYGLDQMYGVENDKGYLHLRFLATLYTLLLIVLFIFMIIFQVFGTFILDYLRESLADLHITFIFSFLYQFRYLIFLVAGILILTLIYTLVPQEKQSLLEQVPGAIVAMVALALFSKIFSAIVNPSHYSLYYGSLAVATIGMVWIYWCSYIILLGGYINWYFRYLTQTILYKIKHRKD